MVPEGVGERVRRVEMLEVGCQEACAYALGKGKFISSYARARRRCRRSEAKVSKSSENRLSGTMAESITASIDVGIFSRYSLGLAPPRAILSVLLRNAKLTNELISHSG